MLNCKKTLKILGESPKIIILLNGKFNVDLMKELEKRTTWFLCADGGANYLYDLRLKKLLDIIPHIIKGDLDSLNQETFNHYQSMGTTIKKQEDQDKSDFEKIIEEAIEISDNQTDIHIFGNFGMRLDHSFAIFSNILKYQKNNPDRNFIIFGESSILRVLLPGNYEITIDDEIEQQTGIGIFPAGKSQAILGTEGLKWNLFSEQPLKFGQFISSSNEAVQSTIQVNTNDPIYFITQLNEQFKVQ